MIKTIKIKNDKCSPQFEIFEVIKAQQLTVEKLQIINQDLIMGFSKSEQHMKIWSVSKRQAVFEHFFDQRKKANELLIIQNLNDLVAYSFSDKQVYIWNVEFKNGFSLLYELSYEQQIQKIKLSYNPFLLGILYNDQKIRQLKKDQQESNFVYQQYQIEDYSFFQKLNFLAIMSKKGFVYIFSINSKKYIKQWNAHQRGQCSIDGIDKDQLIVTQAKDYSIKIWHMRTYHLLKVIDSRKMLISQYDKYNYTLLMSTFKPSLDIISLRTSKLIQSLEVDYPILKIEIESESKLIAILDYDFQIILLRNKQY
ncbi:unnamed protein product [Paramecium sonneborni]|uniref:Uncharacterized protein n=1 Tax=Paramecium sonneborni TaxID=65129 RepID=A0A8S1KMS9_9CILI|nr:unnamed protein product [Paramecium sonneborni]